MRPTKGSGEVSSNLTVQEAISETVHSSYDAAGQHIPPKAIAQGMNVPVARLYEIADDMRQVKCKADELPSLVMSSGPNFLVLDTIERSVGRAAFQIPTSCRPGDVLALSAKSAREFGAFLGDMATFDADGTWTSDEIARAKRRRDFLFVAVNATIARAEQIEQGDHR